MIGIYVYKGFDLEKRRLKDGYSPISNNYVVVSLDDQGVDFDKTESISQIYSMRKYFFDFMQFKFCIRDAAEAQTWASLSDEDKDICIELDVLDNSTDKIVYLMSKGHTMIEARSILIERFGVVHHEAIRSSRNRAEYKSAYQIGANYLNTPDFADFFRLIETLYGEYVNQSIFGTTDGQGGVGILDFFESTPGTNYEFAGLAEQGFVMQNGDPDASNLVTELSNWFRYAV